MHELTVLPNHHWNAITARKLGVIKFSYKLRVTGILFCFGLILNRKLSNKIPKSAFSEKISVNNFA